MQQDPNLRTMGQPQRCGDGAIQDVVGPKSTHVAMRCMYCTYIRTYTIHLRFNINSLSRDIAMTSQSCTFSNFEPSHWRSSLWAWRWYPASRLVPCLQTCDVNHMRRNDSTCHSMFNACVHFWPKNQETGDLK